ncbi:hypothetical protein [Alteromonas stellipolaris]|uniref:Uncharacterized protein n=1 Tax=Alteromonas stellipolaris TaxID=233316 RepID=A0ABN4LV17_9ALTE|nr:hypothetical protein AVL57_00970 [Alteromonas stellipolaris]
MKQIIEKIPNDLDALFFNYGQLKHDFLVMCASRILDHDIARKIFSDGYRLVLNDHEEIFSGEFENAKVGLITVHFNSVCLRVAPNGFFKATEKLNSHDLWPELHYLTLPVVAQVATPYPSKLEDASTYISSYAEPIESGALEIEATEKVITWLAHEMSLTTDIGNPFTKAEHREIWSKEYEDSIDA